MDEDEEDCFEHLDILEVEEAEDIKTGFKLNFHFRENPFFSNKCLTKEFKLGAEGTVPSSVSTAIVWHEGKDLTKLLQSKDQATGRRRRHREYKAFFEWFQDNTDPVNDEIAELIKDDLWPNPLQYFLVPDIEVDDEEEDEDPDDDEGDEEDDADAPGDDDE